MHPYLIEWKEVFVAERAFRLANRNQTVAQELDDLRLGVQLHVLNICLHFGQLRRYQQFNIVANRKKSTLSQLK